MIVFSNTAHAARRPQAAQFQGRFTPGGEIL
jgi:hypothetical protein